MKRHVNPPAPIIVSVGNDWSKEQIDKILLPVFKKITSTVSSPDENHFSIVITPLRKGSKHLAKAGIIHKATPVPPAINKKQKVKPK
jgi:hypothetical protein